MKKIIYSLIAAIGLVTSALGQISTIREDNVWVFTKDISGNISSANVAAAVSTTVSNNIFAMSTNISLNATYGSNTAYAVSNMVDSATNRLSVIESLTNNYNISTNWITANSNNIALKNTTNIFTGSTNTFITIAATNIIQRGTITNQFGGNITFTTVSTNNSFITANGTGLTFQVLGDQYGPVKLHLQNRNGVNGVMFEQAGTVDLVDFVFKGTNNQRNIRYENRAANKYVSGATTNFGEFQFGPAGTPSLVVGDTNVSVRLGYLGVGTNLPGARLHVAGTMLATGLNITTNAGTNVATGFILWTNQTGNVGVNPVFNTVTTTNSTVTNTFAGVIYGKVKSPTFHTELTAVTPSIYIVPNVVQPLILTNNIQDSFGGYSTNTGRYTIPQSWGPCQYKVYGAACAGYGSTQTVQYGFFEVTPLFSTNLLCYGQVTKTPVGNVPMIPWIGVINYTGGLHQVYPFAYTDTVTNWITNLTGRTMFNVDAGGAQ